MIRPNIAIRRNTSATGSIRSNIMRSPLRRRDHQPCMIEHLLHASDPRLWLWHNICGRIAMDAARVAADVLESSLQASRVNAVGHGFNQCDGQGCAIRQGVGASFTGACASDRCA